MLDEITPPTQEGESFAKIRLLFPENAPASLLEPGARLELYEGKKVVAFVQVLPSDQQGGAAL